MISPAGRRNLLRDMSGTDILITVFIFAFGACIGSFLNVIIYRLPRGQSIVFPGSHCPSCGRAIGWYDNIPIVSWLVLRGRCRRCGVSISPQYIVIEAVTAALLAGLYVWYFVLQMRRGVGSPAEDWPMLLAHAALWCGLLACTAMDIEHWIIPLEVCWFLSLLGAAVATIHPPGLAVLPRVAPATGAMGIAAGVGLILSALLQRYGLLQPSFIDAGDTVSCERADPAGKDDGGKIVAVAASREHGVNPRSEILREVLYLMPAIVLAAAVWLVVRFVPAVDLWVRRLSDDQQMGRFALHFSGFQAALVGYLAGGLLVWGTRIFGTLAFGKEAMGLGDVHILAAVGAVTGFIVPVLAFFVAPILGLLWAGKLLITGKQRELPYGPWLALATGLVMLFHDGIIDALRTMVRGAAY